MKKLFFVFVFFLIAGLFNACSEEQVNPTEEGGATSSNSEQWKDG